MRITKRELDHSECPMNLAEVLCRIYSELADQYKLLDAASAVAKRHVLAEHLKEVIDTLEQKVLSCVNQRDAYGAPS